MESNNKFKTPEKSRNFIKLKCLKPRKNKKKFNLLSSFLKNSKIEKLNKIKIGLPPLFNENDLNKIPINFKSNVLFKELPLNNNFFINNNTQDHQIISNSKNQIYNDNIVSYEAFNPFQDLTDLNTKINNNTQCISNLNSNISNSILTKPFFVNDLSFGSSNRNKAKNNEKLTFTPKSV